MKLSRSIIALVCALFVSPALAQSNQGASPLTGRKGGTNNGFMQFTGPASTLKTFTLPNASDTICTLNAPQGFTAAKTFSDLTLLLAGSSSGTTTLKASAAASGTLTLPAATDTLVARDTTDTFTHKTFDTADGNSLKINGLAATDNTGAGKVVRDTSPTLVTPTLGAATATSINKVTITAPASGATLTIPDGVAITAPAATDTLVGRTSTDTLANKSIDTASNTLKLNGVAFGTASQATAALNVVVGDTGTGGAKGLVPAPGPGDAAAGKYLDAAGGYSVPAGGGGAGGLTDEDRQNAAHRDIYLAKLLGAPFRGIKTWADGYKSSAGINASASSSYQVDTVNGRVSPVFSDVYSTEVSTTLNENNGSWSGYTIRNILPPGIAASGDQLRITVSPPTSISGTVLSDVFVGHPGSGSAFDGTQVRVLFSGSSSVTLTMGGSSITSDPVAYAYDSSKPLMIAVRYTSGTTRRNTSLGSSYSYYAKASSSVSDASDTAPSGFGSAVSGRSDMVSLVEARTVAGGTGLTIRTVAQSTDSSVSNGRVLIKYDNGEAPTLNSDIIAKVRCDGASAFSTATLSAVTAYSQGGLSVAETADTACASSGTSFEAQIETANSKNVSIYGLDWTAR